MSEDVSRRKLIAGASALSGLMLSGCNNDNAYLPPHLKHGFGGVGEALTMASHRLLMTRNSISPEYKVSDISPHFPVEGTAYPEGEEYRRLLHGDFEGWRLPVTGLVNRPVTLSLAELKRMPSRTQITSHTCEKGWTAIVQWTGVQVSRLLAQAGGLKPNGRYVVFRSIDGAARSFDLFDAFHKQTILAYGMNGKNVPIPHGAPLRLRMERHVGYASIKYISALEVIERPGAPGKSGWHWYTGA